MHSNQQRIETQPVLVKNILANPDFYHPNRIFTEELHAIITAHMPISQAPVFTPIKTLCIFLYQLNQADRSCQNAVDAFAMQYDDFIENTYTGSYCKARQKLPLGMITELSKQVAQQTITAMPGSWRWLGRPVKLIDGTTLSMPDTPENQAVYPQPDSQKEGVGFPLCRVTAVFCYATGVILNAQVAPQKGKGTGENTMFRSMFDSFDAGDVVLGDAIFATYFSLAALIERGIDGIFEQHGSRKTDFNQGKKLGLLDHIVTYKKPKVKPDWMSKEAYLAAPDSILVRELKAGGKILVTTLLCADLYTKQSLGELYNSRWNVELDLRNVKTTMGMDILSCKSPAMIHKEIWMYFWAYNLVRQTMAKAAILGDVLPRQLSFKHSLQLSRKHCQNNQPSQKEHDKLLRLILQKRVGNRPGRIEPRAIKRRPKPFPLMTKPRAAARAHVKQYGHPEQ